MTELQQRLAAEITLWKWLKQTKANRVVLDNSRNRGKALIEQINASNPPACDPLKTAYWMPRSSRKLTPVKQQGKWLGFYINSPGAAQSLKWYEREILEVAA